MSEKAKDVLEEWKAIGITPKAENDFIESYKDFVLSCVPTTPNWAEDLATAVLSTVVGPKRIVATRIGKLKLNVWHVFIGPSGISYKTVPLRDYVIGTFLVLKEKMETKDFILPSSFSMEGMVEYLSKNPEGIIIRDEVSTLFKEPSAKEYNQDLLEFLSQLYDGTLQKRFTRKAKLEEVQHCYVVFLGATTPYLYNVLRPEVFVQGLGNRILFDFWSGEVAKIEAEDFFFEGVGEEERQRRIEDFAEKLAKIAEGKVETFLIPVDGAARMLVGYKSKKDEEASVLFKADKSDLRYSYLSRCGEMAIKLAGLKAISRRWRDEESLKREDLPISVEDARWAIAKVERHAKNFMRLLAEWRTKPVEVRPRSYKLSKEALITAIRNSPDGIMTQEELLNALGWYKCSDYFYMRDTIVSDPKSGIRRMDEKEIEALPIDVKRRHGLEVRRGSVPFVFAVVKDAK